MDSKIAANLEALTGLMSAMKEVLTDLNGSVKAFNSNANNMSSAISDAEKNAESLNKALKGSQSSFKEYNEVLKNGLKNVEDTQSSMQDKIERANKSIIARYGIFFSAREKQHVQHQKSILGKLRNYAKEQAEIFHNLDSRRAKLLHAFDITKDIFKTFFSFGNSLFKIFKSVSGTVLNVAKFIVTLPLKGLEAILDIAHSVREEFLAISQTFEDTQEMISGSSRQGMGLANLTSEVRGLGGAFLNVGSEAARTFGYALQGQQAMISKTAEKINGLGTLANLYGTSYSSNAILVERAMQSLGMSVEDNAILVRQSMSEGIHPFDALNRSIIASTEASREFGIDQKQIARGMNELRKNVVEFSHISEPELASVVAQAAQLGIEAKELNAVFSKFTTFDQAAESAALLSQTFGMAVDAMDIIRAEDPMEIINQFREGMQQTGRDFRDLNRHEKALLSQYTGLSGEALQTAMSFQGVGLSYEELQKKMEENSPQAQLQKTVKEMSSSIKEFMNVGKKLTSPFQAISEGMKDALLKNGRFQRSMMGLSNRMQRLYSGVLSKFLNAGLLDSIEGVVDAFGQLISDDAIKSLVDITREFGNFLTVVLNANSKPQEITNAFDKLISTFTKSTFVKKLFETGKIIIGKIAEGIIKSLPAILGSIRDLVSYFNTETPKAFDESDDSWFNTYIGKTLRTPMGDGKTVAQSISALVLDIISELKKAIGTSGDLLTEAFRPVGVALGEGLKEGIGLGNISLGLAAALVLGVGPGLTLVLSQYLLTKIPKIIPGMANLLKDSMNKRFPNQSPSPDGQRSLPGMGNPNSGGGKPNIATRAARFGLRHAGKILPTTLVSGAADYMTEGRKETQQQRGNTVSAGAYEVGDVTQDVASYAGWGSLILGVLGTGAAAVGAAAAAPFIATAAGIAGTVALGAAGVSLVANSVGYLTETSEEEAAANAAARAEQASSNQQMINAMSAASAAQEQSGQALMAQNVADRALVEGIAAKVSQSNVPSELAQTQNAALQQQQAELRASLVQMQQSQNERPIQVSINIENKMDNEIVSNNVVQRLITGTNKFQIETDNDNTAKLLMRNSQGEVSPRPT